MKKWMVTFVCVVMVSLTFAEDQIQQISLEKVQQVLKAPVAPHPRLFLNDRQLPEVMAKIKNTENLSVLHKEAIKQADALLKKEPLKRKKTGRRLLSVSRAALKRIMILGWAYRSTGDDRYLKRAETEMLAVAAFSDWNPSHFLDVAEMTAALAVGYDWLYKDLSPQSREMIRQAIVEKGIRPSLNEDPKPQWWINTSNNWNQVCHGGITCGVLAVMEDEPVLAETIIHRSVNKVQIAMNEYEPHGAYPEGPGYWIYGTTYNVLLLAALDSALGTDFGVSEKNGFAKSGDYFLHVTGPTGLFFNYPDSGTKPSLTPAVYWFAKKYNKPSLTWYQQKIWSRAVRSSSSRLLQDYTAVLALIWACPETVRPDTLAWMGQGRNPVAMLRSSWDDDAVFLGIKGGTPGSNHAHMDVGSFVLDAQGCRWAIDLGPENYNRIETLGMGLWNGKQDGDRWKLFRYNNFSHNTLTVNDQLQQVSGFAPIIRYSADAVFPHAVIDMTAVYNGQLKKALRGGAILPSGGVLIQDQLQAPDTPVNVRWAMATPAEVKLQSDRKARLIQKDKVMQFQILTDADVKLTTFSTEPRAEYDAPNPNTRMIGFNVELPPNKEFTIRVLMTPGQKEKTVEQDFQTLENWSPSLP